MLKNARNKILLIRPKDNMPVFWFPLGFAYLKSDIPKRYQVKIFDCAFLDLPASSSRFQKEVMEFAPDIVGISISTLVLKEALEVLKKVKTINQKTITVVGGPHPSLYPDELMKNDFIDYLFRGDAEIAFPKFLNALECGDGFNLIKGLTYRSNDTIVKNDFDWETNLDQPNFPDYQAAGLEEYLKNGYNYGGFYGRTAPIWITRGCPYLCQYCSAPLINGRQVRAPSVLYVVRMIKHLYDQFRIRQFTIVDDNFTFYPDYTKEFCREIIKCKKENYFSEKISFATPNGIRLERIDDELLVLMKKAGWEGVTIAPESGSRKTLDRMKKMINPDKVPDIVARIKRCGLRVRAFFIVGYPGETKEDLEATVRLIRKCKLDALIVHLFHPIPGTPIFDELVKEKIIPHDFVPCSFCKAYLPRIFKKTIEQQYVAPGFENFSLFWFMLKENLLLALRNPYSLIYFVKINGIMNIIKKLSRLAVE
ncbi:MAG: hypothetical protein A3G33_05220 [Omnitrophica bacterium RIFCSPLOWO2_12_FULL_44_17]|uniref:Uncharacterized protein n=1 Tax=Candidatus Danuiimicrobium aquiferis TaxID=1801832 RepID=A0A1G1KQD1_9BACT|nr:MAG: hypothetical protein A3B72_04925 [Omnitrophica bacterium RIFCSPHIGHO2_02_FULL_45_28]OGW91252.1 MAG: hypothetical protein A3E74_04575 [Omnitrophica bacterium RIFCSPHIGHO2_12_FULL_44_12]OGW95035.1 MAG: hypothetical protein A3G33_05220 [Omnitrophica bacterium RIFCSPLOWO2_12_FULL_44_17]OGX02956.1 MAG: hypothetical protein A3J12_01440 [Omnitrophica bacterium RIFCSPLOWO2_02_FULL_44_11]